jgi:DNA-dependent RNA polymerase auxiliary subunit epsilon
VLLTLLQYYQWKLNGRKRIEQKIGEAIGLEIAAQKSVDELVSKGLLKAEHEKKLRPMQEEANTQQNEMEALVKEIAEDEDFDIENINSVSEETAQKASKIMETYLGEEPDTQEALEFLCLAEGAEVTHYEVLSSVTKEVKSKKFGTKVRDILKEEQNHLEMCTKLAKQNISKE